MALLMMGGYLAVIAMLLGWLDPKAVRVTDVKLDGKYRVAKRRVRVKSIRPGTYTVTLVLLDVDTDERVVVTYHEGALFKPRRFGP